MKQIGFKGEVIKEIRTDTNTIQKWKKITAICPYCLYRASLDKFLVRYAVKRKGTNISRSKVKCPCCGNGMFKKTVIKTAEMSMQDYAYWFWGNIFSKWGIYEKVDWDNLKERLKMHTRQQQEIFWEVYREYKESSNRNRVTADWDDYVYYREQEEQKRTQLI